MMCLTRTNEWAIFIQSILQNKIVIHPTNWRNVIFFQSLLWL